MTRIAVLLSACLALNGLPALAMEPPALGKLESYRHDGSLAERLRRARSLGNHRISPSLFNHFNARMEALRSGKPFDSSAFPFQTGLPSTGSPRMAVLLVDFPDFPHAQDVAIFEDKVFGAGLQGEFPYESLKSFYSRSSYDALNVQGSVLGWYRAQNARAVYGATDYSGVRALIKEAIDSFDPTHDFAQYDNNNNGVIDYFCVLWTGPDEGWGSLWWAWNDPWGQTFADDPYTVDGKRLGVFTWQWDKNDAYEQPEFEARVIIHETGHALGLPDYYDYDDNVGPIGGLGGLDIMDGVEGDHNALSKWLLDWVTPTVIGAADGDHVLQLAASHQSKDCVAIMPGLNVNQYFKEFFIVQNRHAGGNDIRYQNLEDYQGGMLIWHIDARLNGFQSDFAWDNSYTSHKFLRLMEADGLEEISQSDGTGFVADGGDFYTPGKTFSPSSMPNSNEYAGAATGIIVDGFTTPGQVMTARFTLGGGGGVTRGDVNQDAGINAADAIMVSRHISGAAPLTGDALTAADADSSGAVNQSDVDWILEKDVGLR